MRRTGNIILILLLISAFLFSFFQVLPKVGGVLLNTETWAGSKKLLPERRIRQIVLHCTLAEYDPVRYEAALLIAENWRKLGFDVKVIPLEGKRLLSEALDRNYDASTMSWMGRAERIDPDMLCFIALHSSQAGKGKFNFNDYRNPEYDKWAELQRSTMDIQKRREAVFKCQEIFAKDQPHTPLFSRTLLMPANIRDWTDWTVMMGEGLNSFWTFMNVKPKTNRRDLRWGYPLDLTTLNPLAGLATHDFQTLRLVYDRLVRISTKGLPEKWAAEEIKQIDNTTFDVKIRSGMKFHDGKPVTAEDVKFSFEYPAKVQSGFFMGKVRPIASIEIIDNLTVRFKLKKPVATFLSTCLGSVFILPKHLWEGIPESVGLKTIREYTNEKPIGSGPFKIVYWRRGEEMKFERFEGYFNPPHVDSILKIVYPNAQGMVGGVATGECDFGSLWIRPIHVDQLKKTAPHVKVLRVRDHGYQNINYNNSRKPFDDVAIRRALAYAIPKTLIVDRLLEGYGEANHSIIAPANEFWHNPNVEKFDLDLERAKKTLADAGYEWDDNGRIYYPEGKKDD